MTSVDSGVETGNDSNDSAQTENQLNNQGFIKSSNVGMSTNSQIQIFQKHELDTSDVNLLMSPTSTAICRSENTLTLTPQSNLGNGSDGSIVFHLDSETVQNLQFKTPHNLLIYSKLMKKIPGITCPKCPNNIHSNDTSDQDLKPLSLRMPSVQKSKMLSLRKMPYLVGGSHARMARRMRFAVTINSTELVKRMLDKGISPNNHDEEGRSPLHLASCRGYAEIVKLLLDYGANPNQIDCIGNTPLHLAAITGREAVVELLLNAGTNVCLSNRHGYNSIQLAQTRLRMLQNCTRSDMNCVKDEIHRIISMLLTYFKQGEHTREQIETLTSFCSRISLSNTTDQVQDDIKDLLASIDALSLTN